jgi:hypothetical protein
MISELPINGKLRIDSNFFLIIGFNSTIFLLNPEIGERFRIIEP